MGLWPDRHGVGYCRKFPKALPKWKLFLATLDFEMVHTPSDLASLAALNLKVPPFLTTFDLRQPPITRYRQPMPKLPERLHEPGHATESPGQLGRLISKKVLQLLA